MQGSFVGLADYNHLQGGDSIAGGAFANPAVVAELRKALATNANIGADGSALIPQSLESTLKIVTFKMKEIKLWQRLTKRPAYATTEEYNQLLEYGLGESAFIQEGGLPQDDSSEYVRQTDLVKYLGTVRAVTHPMTLVRTAGVGNIIDMEDTNGTMHLLRLLEVALFHGNSSLNPRAFDGLAKLIRTKSPENVIDLRGKPMTASVMESIDQRMAYAYGEIDTLYMSTVAKADLTRSLMPVGQNRILLPQSGTDTALGMTVKKYEGNNSTFDLENHKFIRQNVPWKASIKQAISARVAGKPGVVTAVPAAAIGEFSRLAAGLYTYRVAAVNSFGEGLASDAVTIASAAAANDKITVTIPAVQGALSYRIYRNVAGTTTLYLLDEVADSGGATTVYVDRGLYIPGCSTAFGLFLDGDQGMSWKQLAPLMKLPLAQIDTSMRWAILLYGVLQMYQPKKQMLVINVGSTGMAAQPEAEADPALTEFLKTL